MADTPQLSRTQRGDRTTSRRDVLRRGAVAVSGTAVGAVLAGCGSGDAGTGAGGPVPVELWHGQEDTGRKAIEKLVREFNRTHPHIRVDAAAGVLADAMLQKVTAALASGSYPDIAYVFGSDLAGIARSPQVADLTGMVRKSPTPWSEYWKPARDAVTVNGRVRAAPAVLDTLAVVCNKKLFASRGVPLPKPGWTWDDFVRTARLLTDRDHGVFGTGWPGVGDEDTVWRLWPMVWDLGGEVVDADGRHIGFGKVGAKALGTIARLVRDKSVYVDPKPGTEQMYRVFLSGRMGMSVTGPWQLPDVITAKVDYHVAPLPSYSGRPVTISGPDTWTVFDNGSARVQAAETFLTWLMQPARDVRWDIESGSLPLSRRTRELPAWQRRNARTEGLSTFTRALETARVRPAHPAYPQISRAVGQAVTAVLLGRSSPEEAMRRCTDDADAALLIPR